MADKVLCPFCGAEMRETIYNDAVWADTKQTVHEAYHAFCKCRLCGAQGPVEYRKVGNTAAEAARAAALRRYTPPIKPMTLGEARLRSYAYEPMFVESKFTGLWHGLSPVNGWVVGFGWLRPWVDSDAEPRGYIEKGYGVYWRCWERKPTDEERRAAEWEK